MVAVVKLVSGDLVQVFVPTIANSVMIYDGSHGLPAVDTSWPKRSYPVIGIDTRVPPERALLWVRDTDIENVVSVRSTAVSRAFIAHERYGGRLVPQSNLVGLDVTWVTEEALNAALLPSEPARVPPANCRNCQEPNHYGAINQPDGTFICYGCRQDPWTRKRHV